MYTGTATIKRQNTNVEKVAANGWATLAELSKGAHGTARKELRRDYVLHAQNSGLWLPSVLDARDGALKFLNAARWFRACYKANTRKDSRIALENKAKHASTLKNARNYRETNRAGIILPF